MNYSLLEYTDPVDRLLPFSMKAAVVHKFGEPLTIDNLPVPRPGGNQVLIKVAACGVCHSDLHAARGEWPVKPHLPFVPGHEVAGTVVKAGNRVRKIKAGDRVGVTWLYQTCGRCEFCLTGRETLCKTQRNTGYSANGGFAEYIMADADYVVPLPASLSFEQAAPLIGAGVTAYKALKMAEVRAGQWVAIYGIGGLGHLAVEYALAMGCRVAAVDIDNFKLDLAERLGAEKLINSRQENPVKTLQTSLEGVQAAIITTPSASAFEQGLGSLKPGGTCVLVGLPPEKFQVDIYSTVLNGLTIRGSIAGTRADLAEALELAATDKVQPICQVAPLAAVNEVFGRLERGDVEGKFVLTM